MSRFPTAARALRDCALALVLAASLAANAAAAAPPAAPPPPKPKPYQPVVQNEVTAAYEYRTRILTGKPACQRYATEADNVFIDDKLDSTTKVGRLNQIGKDAGANACLAP